jgi:hypothetical protein
MSERAPRERLFYYALVPAILIAVFVLGTLTLRITPKIEDAQREGVLKLTYDLAGERAQILDDHIIRQDNVVAAHTDLEGLRSIGERWLPTAARETPDGAGHPRARHGPLGARGGGVRVAVPGAGRRRVQAYSSDAAAPADEPRRAPRRSCGTCTTCSTGRATS